MMMLAPIAGFQPLKPIKPQPVSIGEAIAAAELFCSRVDLKPLPAVRSVQFSDRDRTTFGGVPRYHVTMMPPGKSRSFDIQVDAVSGDVMFASDSSGVGKRPSKAVSDRWIRRLGLAQGVTYDAQLARYDLKAGNTPICNLNGDSQASFFVYNGLFSWYQGPSAPPDAPRHPPRFSAVQAATWVFDQRKKMMPHWPQKLEERVEPVVFYDDQSSLAKWAWRVSYGSAANGRYTAMWTQILDGDTGQMIPQDRVMSSRLVYRSRAPRSGLAHVPLNDSAHQWLARLDSKMSELGRAGAIPQQLVFGPTLQAFYGDMSVVIKPSGDLLSFATRGHPGRMADSAAALEFGKKFILAQHPAAVEGRFRLENGQGLRNSSVRFDQSAFGYPYFSSPLATVNFDSRGTVFVFHIFPASPRPTAAPGPVVSREAIEQKARTDSHIDGRPPMVVGPGWLPLPEGKAVRLVYQAIILPQIAHSQPWSGLYDAQTGAYLGSPAPPPSS